MRIDLPNSNEFKKILSTLTQKTIDYKINGISTDSRNIKENDIYIAIKGEKFDGNEFTKDALNRGSSFAIVHQIQNEKIDYEVILVSKDTNMRLKARSLSIGAEDYTTDKVKDIDHIHNGSRLVENIDDAEIDLIYDSNKVKADKIASIESPKTNENYIIRNGKKSVLAVFDSFENFYIKFSKTPAMP